MGCAARPQPPGDLAPSPEVINKVPVATSMSSTTYLYLLQHTREPPVLRQLREETAGLGGSNMQVKPYALKSNVMPCCGWAASGGFACVVSAGAPAAKKVEHLATSSLVPVRPRSRMMIMTLLDCVS